MKWHSQLKIRFFQAVPPDRSMHTWFLIHVFEGTLQSGALGVDETNYHIYCVSNEPEEVKCLPRAEMIRAWFDQATKS